MIRTRSLTKKYGSFMAVDGIDLNIPRGEIYGFLGPNGAGKTSTILMLLSIVRPTTGEIWLFDELYKPNRLDLRKRIGVVPEKHPRGIWPWMTAREYLSFFADLYEVPSPKARIAALFEKVDLTRVANKRIREFSHGMLQKLSFIRALLSDPDILLLDEPISGLDPLGIKQVRDLIVSENREGRTIFISSHQLSEMERICHRVAIIHEGRLVAEDTMQALLARVTAEREIRVELDSTPGDLLGRVRTLPFVQEAQLDGRTLTVKVTREGDVRRQLSQFLIRLALVPLAISEKVASLEEAFVTITQENIGQLTRGGTS